MYKIATDTMNAIAIQHHTVGDNSSVILNHEMPRSGRWGIAKISFDPSMYVGMTNKFVLVGVTMNFAITTSVEFPTSAGKLLAWIGKNTSWVAFISRKRNDIKGFHTRLRICTFLSNTLTSKVSLHAWRFEILLSGKKFTLVVKVHDEHLSHEDSIIGVVSTHLPFSVNGK